LIRVLFFLRLKSLLIDLRRKHCYVLKLDGDGGIVYSLFFYI
jgi:hypothetical protein